MKITNCGRGIHQREIPGLDKLRELPDHWHAFTNLDLALPGKGVREIDVIMVIEDRVLLVDLKDWYGPITSHDGNWLNNGRDNGRSPVRKISENVRELVPLLKRFLENQERKEQGPKQKLYSPWLEGVVVLTRVGDRSGISDTEVSRVFSIEPFMKMIKNRSERDAQLSVPLSKNTDFTSQAWIDRFRRFFNVSQGIFKPGTKRYGGFRAVLDSPTFMQRSGVFSEFDVEEESVAMSSGLLRKWDFTKADTRFQSEEGRSIIAGREKVVVAWLNDRNPLCESTLFQPRVDDHERGVHYWEIFERRRRLKRLSEFCSTELHRSTPAERIELTRQVLHATKTLHDLQAAHLDIGSHSVWVEAPSTVRLSHLMAASFPEVQTLGESRFQFLSSVSAPEDVLGGPVVALRKDVFLLGCVAHQLLFGALPKNSNNGEPPEWDATVDIDNVYAALHVWFERSLDIDVKNRYASASDMLDAFNIATSSRPNPKDIIEGLDRFRVLKSQMQVIREYPDSGILREDDRVVIWRSKPADEEYIVKLWKSTSWGDLVKEAPRILAFLERAEALVEAPLPGIVRFKRVIWTGDAIVLVQESILGSTLRDEMQSMEAFPTPAAAILFISSLVDIIGGLHDRSVAHGDLKPENILVLRSDDPIHPAMPVLIDVLDFSPIGDGDRISRAYTPPMGGRFERDRFAITKITEDLLASHELGEDARSDIATAVDQCRDGPPANGTLLPLKEALEKAILPVAERPIDEVFKVSVLGAVRGPLLSDEGMYGLSRSGPHLNIRGAVERLEITLDQTGRPVRAKRIALSQVEIQRWKHSEFASFPGSMTIADTSVNDLSVIAELMARTDIADAWSSRTQKPPSAIRDDGEQDAAPSEVVADELAERAASSDAMSAPVNVRQMWRRFIDLEAGLTVEAKTIGDSTYRRAVRRHVAPIQMESGDLDFDRNDKVVVERQDSRGRWINIGLLDVSASASNFVVIDSGSESGKPSQPLLLDNVRLRFQSHYENTSRTRREEATSRILRGAAAAADLFNAFDVNIGTLPRHKPTEVDEAWLEERYSLNSVQIDAFKKIVGCRPMGLLQGPPGTGKTRFIAALVHYALTHGLAKNVLLASQSHEAVNNAGEAVLRLFGNDRDALSLIRVGHEGSVSEPLKPYHAARVERAYKDQFLATSRQRLGVVADALGLDTEIADKVIYFEDAVRPVLERISELSNDGVEDLSRLNALISTVEQQVSPLEIMLDLSGIESSDIESEVTSQFFESLPTPISAQVDKLRQAAQLGRDIVGSASSWQRSFETFLAGTRQVVAGTCVGLGRTSLGLTKTVFDLVIVDEAARCSASELAVPIQAGKWVVLVGDHRQLEPLYRPELVDALSLDLKASLDEILRSDFERVFSSPYGRSGGATLTKQYRMLPPIGRIVSSAFYDRVLQHGRKEPEIPQAVFPPELAKTITWVMTDVLGTVAYQRTQGQRGSLTNPIEAELIVAMLKRWATYVPFTTWISGQSRHPQPIGVICSYAAQRDLIWKKLQGESLPDEFRQAIKVDTIDSYQGKENLVVIVSLVRNNADGPIEGGAATIKPGFMSRKNRVNVAMSRAMDRLVVVGAKNGWKAGSPVERVASGFAEEVKSNEAMVIDAKELLEILAAGTKGKKKPYSASANGIQEGAV